MAPSGGGDGAFAVRQAWASASTEPSIWCGAPVWATAILATVTAIAIAAASRGRRDAVLAHFERVGDPDPARSRQLVEALNPGEQENLITQRRRAIATLRERGLIDLDEAVQVESLPLGQSLAITT